jgi:rare lipoprotein A
VQVNDRLHPKNKRLVDMTKSGAEALGYVENGVARVKLEVLANKKSKL